MVGVMFSYDVHVRRLYWVGEGKDRKEQLEGNCYSFGSILQAVEFASKTPCIDGLWVIEITLNGAVLETFTLIDWKKLGQGDIIRSKLNKLVKDFENGKLKRNDEGLIVERSRFVEELKKL